MKSEIKKRIEQIQKDVVPEGYKKTKVGIVPNEWKVDKAKTIFANFTNKRHNGNLNVLSVTQDRGIIPRSEVDIDIKYSEDSVGSYKKVEKGDFVISLRSFQGGIEHSEYNGLVSPAYIVLKSHIDISEGYYRRYFKTESFISRLSSTIYGIRDGKQIGYDDFCNLFLHIPPVPEQEKIAEILSTWDEAIDLKKRLIAEKKQQKKWLMQNLLTSEKHLPGFTDKWQVVRLGDLGELARGKGVSRANVVETGFPFISYGEIYTTHNIGIKRYRTFINSKGREECFRIYKGDIIFTGSGESAKEIGKAVVFLFDDEAYAGGDTIVFTQKGNDSLFLAYMLNSDYVINQLASLGQGNSVVHIYPSQLAQIRFLIPLLPEQVAIANVLSAVDREIGLHEKQLEEIKKQKKSLMQLLLTGIVRVNAQEVS